MALEYKYVDGIIEGFLIILPAMFANATPVIAKGKRPVDFRRNFIDGRRLLGDGKTWEGLAAGMLAGTLTGIILAVLTGNLILAYAGFIASAGAMLGDLAASFIKRRLGLSRGAPAPLLDQLNFYIGAVALLYLAGFKFTLWVFTLLAILSALLHIAANIIAHKTGLKNVPW